jgi:Protein of unknown function with HXXEE motif
MQWLWWAPLVAAVLHIVEEFVYPGGFADWDRSYRPKFRRSITSRLHLAINAALLAACVSVGISGTAGGVVNAGVLAFGSVIPPRWAAPAWLALAALLFSNAIYHVVGTLQTGRVSPGVRTGVLLYVPLAIYGFWYFSSSGLTPVRTSILAALLGGSYHLWARMLHAVHARHSEPH